MMLTKAPENLHKIQNETLDILKKCFKTFAVERYPEVMIDSFFNESEKIYLNENKKLKISQKIIKKIFDDVDRKMKNHYGKWVSITQYDRKGRFKTNINQVFKTDQGKLYNFIDFKNMFFTSHSLERFEERVSNEKYKDIINIYKKIKVNPSIIDVINVLLKVCSQFSIDDNGFLYLNINFGILVVQSINQNVCIVKTFLSPEMNKSFLKWTFFKKEYDIFIDSKLNVDFLIDYKKDMAITFKNPVFELDCYNYALFYDIIYNKKNIKPYYETFGDLTTAEPEYEIIK
jgi:hypothetical protein